MESFLTLRPAARHGRLATRKRRPETARRPGHMMYSAECRSRPGLFARGSTSIGKFPPTWGKLIEFRLNQRHLDHGSS